MVIGNYSSDAIDRNFEHFICQSENRSVEMAERVTIDVGGCKSEVVSVEGMEKEVTKMGDNQEMPIWVRMVMEQMEKMEGRIVEKFEVREKERKDLHVRSDKNNKDIMKGMEDDVTSVIVDCVSNSKTKKNAGKRENEIQKDLSEIQVIKEVSDEQFVCEKRKDRKCKAVKTKIISVSLAKPKIKNNVQPKARSILKHEIQIRGKASRMKFGRAKERGCRKENKNERKINNTVSAKFDGSSKRTKFKYGSVRRRDGEMNVEKRTVEVIRKKKKQNGGHFRDVIRKIRARNRKMSGGSMTQDSDDNVMMQLTDDCENGKCEVDKEVASICKDIDSDFKKFRVDEVSKQSVSSQVKNANRNIEGEIEECTKYEDENVEGSHCNDMCESEFELGNRNWNNEYSDIRDGLVKCVEHMQQSRFELETFDMHFILLQGEKMVDVKDSKESVISICFNKGNSAEMICSMLITVGSKSYVTAKFTRLSVNERVEPDDCVKQKGNGGFSSKRINGRSMSSMSKEGKCLTSAGVTGQSFALVFSQVVDVLGLHRSQLERCLK